VLIEVGHDGAGRRRVAKRVPARQHFHLIDGGLDGCSQIAALQIQLDGIPLDRAKVREHVDQVRRLRGGRVDAAEVTGDVSLCLPAGERASRGPDDHCERIAHVVRDGGKDRVPLRAKLALANRQPLGFELLFALRGDEQPDGHGNRAEDHLVPPLVHRRKPSGQDDIVADDGSDRDCDRRARATEQCRSDHEQNGQHDVHVVGGGIAGREDGQRAARDDAGKIRHEYARDPRHV